MSHRPALTASFVRLRLRFRRLRGPLERRLGIDCRALAAFRILLGAALLFDALHRSQDLVAFYTDAGALPRSMRLESAHPIVRYAPHMLSGDPRAQALLFGLAALFAIALLVGYRTRLATALSLALLVSVHVRNPLLLNGGDRLLREVLLLALFLPLGRRWAVDALGEREGGRETAALEGERGHRSEVDSGHRQRLLTPATAAVLVYVAGFFANNGQHKRLGDTWASGEALGYAFRQDHMTILLGDYLVDYPLLLEVGSYGWLTLVVGAPLLLVLAGRLRAVAVALYLGAVAGLGLSVAVGLFPVVLTAILLLFLPSGVWDRLEGVGAAIRDRLKSLEWVDSLDLERRRVERLRARVSAIGSRLDPPRGTRSRPLRSRLPLRSGPRRRRLRSAVRWTVLLGVCLWTVGLLGYADPFEPVDGVDPDDSQWRMYAPDPSTSYGWYVVEADLESGAEMDVLRDDAVRSGPPPDAAETFPNFRWRKYMSSLDDDEDRADRFGAYMCDRADDQFDAPVERIEVTYHYRGIDLEGDQPPPERATRVETTCSTA